jgi:hypothetical protein
MTFVACAYQSPVIDVAIRINRISSEKIKVHAKELKLKWGNATPKFCITLRISETKAKATKLDLTNVLKEMKFVEL